MEEDADVADGVEDPCSAEEDTAVAAAATDAITEGRGKEKAGSEWLVGLWGAADDAAAADAAEDDDRAICSLLCRLSLVNNLLLNKKEVLFYCIVLTSRCSLSVVAGPFSILP